MDNDKDLPVKRQTETGETEAPSPAENNSNLRPAETVSAAEPAGLKPAYEKLREEKAQLYDRLLRKQAELENLRKRVQREKEEFRHYAAEDLIRAILPTLDSFERAMTHREPSVPASVYQGMEMIYRELQGVLKRAGLAPIEAKGKRFDPHLHQAVETVEAREGNDQEVVEELQRGYKLRDRLLRPAIVKVAVAPREQNPSTSAKGLTRAGDRR